MSGKLNFGVAVSMNKGNGNKKIPVTTIYVRMGHVVIAKRSIPGRWNTEQAAIEFKKAPERFATVKDGFDATILKKLAA